MRVWMCFKLTDGYDSMVGQRDRHPRRHAGVSSSHAIAGYGGSMTQSGGRDRPAARTGPDARLSHGTAKDRETDNTEIQSAEIKE